MTEPTRAPTIPAEAVWVEERQEFRTSTRLVDGLADGEVRWFRPDGTLAGASLYTAGKVDGPYERFHQNGEWAQRGQMRAGDRVGLCCWRRSTAATTESSIPPSIPEHVREARVFYEDGLPGPSRYYGADGVELRPNGEPLAPRPATVDERAGVNDEGVWFFGWGAQDPATRRGTWRWWATDGVLVRTEEYRAGRCIARLVNHPDGSPQLRTYRDARGWSLLQRLFDASGQEVDTSDEPIPARPAQLPADVLFDSENSRWVGGFTDATLPPMGLITLYELDGTKDETLEFRDGQLRARRCFHRDGRLRSETLHDAQGREVLDVAHDADGELRHRIERVFDKDAVVSIDITSGDSVMRGRRAESGLDWEFFEDSKRIARGRVVDDTAVGRWEFVEGERTHAIDLTELELGAKVDEDFEASWLLGAALLERDEVPREVSALRGVEAIDWEDVPSCYGEKVQHFPRYLRALVSDVRAVRRSALSRISSETLHQGTIYVATAKVIPFILRLLDHPNADATSLVDYLEAVTSQAQRFREEALDWDEDSDDRRAVLGTLEALEQGFAQVAAFLDSSDPNLVATAVALASRAGEQGAALQLRAARHNHWLTAATGVHGLLDGRGDALTAEEAAPWLEHADAIVRLCAAIATARHLGSDSPPRTSAVFCEAIDGPPDLPGRFSSLPFVKGRLLSYAALGLSDVRDDRAMARAVDLSTRLGDVDLFTLDTLSFALLRLCFGEGEPPFAPGFIEVLSAMASCGSLQGFTNFSRSSSRFGLPSQVSEYRALVEALRRHPDPTQLMQETLNVEVEDEYEDDEEYEADDGDEDEEEEEEGEDEES